MLSTERLDRIAELEKQRADAERVLDGIKAKLQEELKGGPPGLNQASCCDNCAHFAKENHTHRYGKCARFQQDGLESHQVCRGWQGRQ